MVIIAKDQVREPLYAVVPLQNQWRWKSRWKHTERAIKHFADSGVTVILVECGFNRRELVFADSGLNGMPANCGILGSDNRFRHRYIGLHTASELWLKENLINVGVQHLTQDQWDWQQVCWLDADIHFIRPNWVGECIHKLQHGTEHDVAFLQMFSHARDVGPNYEMLPETYPHANGMGFVKAWQDGLLQTTLSPEIESELEERGDIDVLAQGFGNPQVQRQQIKQGTAGAGGYYAGRVFPGLAWACTRNAWNAVGGLIDFAAWGGADWHMGHALIEKTEGMMRDDLHANYKKMVNQWYHRCRTRVRRNVLVMEGSVLHNWHGRKTDRGYNAKHSMLAGLGFDPLRHLKRDAQGLYILHDDRSTAFVQLRDMFRKIATERNEDVNEI